MRVYWQRYTFASKSAARACKGPPLGCKLCPSLAQACPTGSLIPIHVHGPDVIVARLHRSDSCENIGADIPCVVDRSVKALRGRAKGFHSTWAARLFPKWLSSNRFSLSAHTD